MWSKLNLNEFHSSLKEVKLDHITIDELPSFDSNQALIKVKCSAVNSTDLFSLLEAYGLYHIKLPASPGYECVGVVEQIGSDVTKVKVGDRVIPILMPNLPSEGHGSWQEYLTIEETKLIIIPEEISDETAAQFFVNYLTPYALIKSLNIPKGDWLIQNAAAGICGKNIYKIATHMGIKVVNLVIRPEQVEEMISYGAEHVVHITDSHSVLQQVIKITSGKCGYAAVDAIGGEQGILMSNVVREGHEVTLYGLMGGLELKAFAHSILFRGITYKGFLLMRYIRLQTEELIMKLCYETIDLLKQNVMDEIPFIKFGYHQIDLAIKSVHQATANGKVLIVPSLPLNQSESMDALSNTLDSKLKLEN